jgi:hypothetical protein
MVDASIDVPDPQDVRETGPVDDAAAVDVVDDAVTADVVDDAVTADAVNDVVDDVPLGDAADDVVVDAPADAAAALRATVDLDIDAACAITATPRAIPVPEGQVLELTLTNHSTHFAADLWPSLGGARIGLRSGASWTVPSPFCAGVRGATQYVEVRVNGRRECTPLRVNVMCP